MTIGTQPSGTGFGTSGLRGLASDLLAGEATAYIKAFYKYLITTNCIEKETDVLVGRDLRSSSPELARQCAAAIAQSGLRPVDCGTVPTPALAHYALQRKCPAIMVTGSHIPANRNGIKFYLPDGEISKADEAAITGLLDLERAGAGALPAEIDGIAANEGHEAVMAAWRARYRAVLPEGSFRNFHIGVHRHSSVATPSLADFLAGYGAKVDLFAKADHFVPLDTEAIGTDLIERYAARVSQNGLDAIASADPDGDRPLLADETGKPLRGDLLGWITAQWLGADTIAVPVTANSAISSRPGMVVTRTRIGSPHVIEAMQAAIRQGAALAVGFETNGGFLLGSPATVNGTRLEPLPTRDSVLPILATLQFTAGADLPLSALARHMNFRAAQSARLAEFPLSASQALIGWLAGDPANIATFIEPLGAVHDVDWTDGMRVTLSSGDIIHIRPSGNAPELRCYCEAENEARAQALLRTGLARIAEFASGPG